MEEILKLPTQEARFIITPDETDERLLQVIELPPFMKHKFYNVHMIIVRHCYQELYDLSTRILLTAPNFNLLFTGVSGIGKTIFMLYFLYRFMNDERFPVKLFAFEFEVNEVVILRVTPEGQLVMSEFPQQRSSLLSKLLSYVLYFVDYTAKIEPKLTGEQGTLIFSSLNPKLYKNRSVEMCVPTWKKKEMRLLNPPNNNWQELFECYGGVPRNVVLKTEVEPYKALEQAFRFKSIDLMRNFFTYGFDSTDQMMNCSLVHINPPVLDGAYQYTSFPVMTIASDEIFKRLSQMKDRHVLFEAARTLNLGTDVAKIKFGAATSGYIFEKLCLWLIPFDGKMLQLRTLPLRLFFGNAEFIRVPHDAELLNFDWEETQILQPNILYKPRTSNLESADSFCLISYNTGLRRQLCHKLIVFQMTVGDTHPIKANELTRIINAFPPSIRNGINSKKFVFVVPPHSNLRVVQPFHTLEGTVMQEANIPMILRDFKQYICQYDLTTS